MGKTSIEWVKEADGTAGETWNPVRGCSRISPGCGGGGSYSGTPDRRGGCYAEGIAARFSGPEQPFHGIAHMTPEGPRWMRDADGKPVVKLIDEKLAEPLRRRVPTTFFLSMFDPFHEALTDEEIASIFGVMFAAYWHRFKVLTKRSSRMERWCALSAGTHVHWCIDAACERLPKRLTFGIKKDVPTTEPAANIWLGVSVEDRKRVERIDRLRRTKAAVRFLSLEPLLEDLGPLDLTGIDQVIVGAESGHGARPMFEAWVRNIRDQAVEQGVAFFYKQRLDSRGHKVSLPLLDGRQWNEQPQIGGAS